MTNMIEQKYFKIFGQRKEFMDIAEETAELLELNKDLTFSIQDFISDEDYEKSIKKINIYRHYICLDKMIRRYFNNMHDVDRFPVLKIEEAVDYKDILKVKKMFDNNLDKKCITYVPTSSKNNDSVVKEIKLHTISELYNYAKSDNIVVFVESAKEYYYSYIFNGLRFFIPLPFINVEDIKSINIYIQFINKHIEDNINDFDKEIIFTTLVDEFNLDYRDINDDSHNLLLSKNKWNSANTVYEQTIKPFLLYDKSNYVEYFEVLSNYLFSVEDVSIDDIMNKRKRFFSELDYDESLIDEYLDKYWMRMYDIGTEYQDVLNLNIIATKEEIVKIKNEVIEKKKADIIFNILAYKKWGLFKFCYVNDLKSITPKDFPALKDNLLKFFKLKTTAKKDFGTKNDNRIDLNGDMFKLHTGQVGNPFSHYEHLYIEKGILDEKETKYNIFVDVSSFLDEYNKYFENKLVVKDKWKFPIHLLNYYVENSVAGFSRFPNHTSYSDWFTKLVTNEYLSKVLPDSRFDCACNTIARYLSRTTKNKKAGIQRTRFLISYSAFISENNERVVPLILKFSIPYKEYVKIREGRHNIFKSDSLALSYKKNSITFKTE